MAVPILLRYQTLSNPQGKTKWIAGEWHGGTSRTTLSNERGFHLFILGIMIIILRPWHVGEGEVTFRLARPQCPGDCSTERQTDSLHRMFHP